MSTNIEIDVVLQKLKKISDETAAQNRQEKLSREETLAIAANILEDFPESTRRDFFKKINDAFDNPEGLVIRRSKYFLEIERSSVPDLYKKKRPAAQRINADYRITGTIYSARRQDNQLYIKVKEPISGVSVEVQTASSGRGSVTTPLPQDDPALFTAYGRVSRDKATLQWSIYRNGSFGGGTNFNDRLATPPRTSNQTDIRYSVSKRSADRSTAFSLPLSNESSIFVYVQNEFEAFNRYKVSENKVYQSVNERNIAVDSQTLEPYTWGDPGYSADWDATGHTRIKYDFLDQVVFSAYEVLCFYVEKGVVRKIPTPPSFLQKMQELMPPVGVNSTDSYFRQIDFDRYYAHNFNTFVTVTNTNYTEEFQSEPSFSDQVWQQSSRYGSVPDENTVLARHFGLGLLNTSEHGDPSFFTPAVFTYIQGPMNLASSSTTEYAFMRANYFRVAPKAYFAPCARLNSCADEQVVEFDQATVGSPVNVKTAINQSKFKRSEKTDAFIGTLDNTESVVYAWNWDLERYCTERLKSLGFTAADLQP